MAKKPKGSRRSETAKWSDPKIIWFAGEAELPEGAIEQHGLSDMVGDLFSKEKKDVEAELKKIVTQMSTLLNAVKPIVKDFSLDEVTFQLGFSAEGHIVFVAKAGVQTSISAKFKRKA